MVWGNAYLLVLILSRESRDILTTIGIDRSSNVVIEEGGLVKGMIMTVHL